MKVITIKQPYASLIAEGIKIYEFRTWKTNYRGAVWIHAGLGVDKKAMEKFKNYHLDYPQGCIIACANLTDCMKIDADMRMMLQKQNPLVYSHVVKDKQWNGYGFRLEDIQKIVPIQVKGKLGLWNYEMNSKCEK